MLFSFPWLSGPEVQLQSFREFRKVKDFFQWFSWGCVFPRLHQGGGSALSAVSDPAVSSFLGRDVPIPVGFIHPSAGPTEC